MFSKSAFVASVLLIVYASCVFYPHWDKWGGQAELGWDDAGYYWYLPSVFIYKDLKHQSFKDTIINKYAPSGNEFQEGYKLDNGNYVMKYSY